MPGAEVASWCTILELGVTMEITYRGRELAVSPEGALDHTGGDANAAAHWLADTLIANFEKG